MTFFEKFGVLCFLEAPVLRFAFLPYYRRVDIGEGVHQSDAGVFANTLLGQTVTNNNLSTPAEDGTGS